MNNESESKQQIVKSSAIIGGASVINIVISLIKIKVLALLLGPAGVGLVSLLSSILSFTATFFGMGLQMSGVRQLAESQSDNEALSRVRSALWTANIALGLLGGLMIWFFRYPISDFIFGNTQQVNDIGLLSVGVFLSLIAGSQTALLQGLRKITELAKVNIASALISAISGLAAVWLWGEKGLVVFVIIAPAGVALVSWYYCRQLPRVDSGKLRFKTLTREWKLLLTLGFVLMLTSLMTHFTQVFVRYLISNEFDMAAVGYFQASWTISMTYIGFVLSAMATDYYPRLVAIINDKQAVNDLMNHQLEMALTLAGPVVILMLALTPIVIYLLYTKEFLQSTEILRWQVFGDLFKIFSWPMGFIILAMGKSRYFFFTELAWNVLYSALIYFGLQYFGINSTGYAFLLVYTLYALIVFFVVRSFHPIKFSWVNIRQFSILVMIAMVLLVLSQYSSAATMILGVAASLILFSLAYKKIEALGVVNDSLKSMKKIFNKFMTMKIVERKL